MGRRPALVILCNLKQLARKLCKNTGASLVKRQFIIFLEVMREMQIRKVHVDALAPTGAMVSAGIVMT